MNDARSFFETVFDPENGASADLTIGYTNKSPEFAFYRFDQRGVVTFFNHLGRTGKVPTFEIASGGTVFEFARSEFDALVDEAETSGLRAFPPSKEEE